MATELKPADPLVICRCFWLVPKLNMGLTKMSICNVLNLSLDYEEMVSDNQGK